MVCCHAHSRLCYSPWAQVIIAFATGILFSPFSYGYLFFIITTLVCELFWIFYVHGWDYIDQWHRPVAILFSLLGWILGRLIVKGKVLEPGHEELRKWFKYIGLSRDEK